MVVPKIFITILLCLITVLGGAQSIILSSTFKKIEHMGAAIPSQVDTILFSFANFTGNLQIITGAPFEISGDNISYNDTITISSSLSNQTLPLYIRIVPSNQDSMYRGEIIFKDNSAVLNKKVFVIGASIAEQQVVSYCTWNMRWFGSPSQCNCDTAIANDNAMNIMREVGADVYALQEIVSIPNLEKLVKKLGVNYHYIVSDYCSQIDDPTITGYESCQKLAFVVDTTKVKLQGSFGLLRSTYPLQQGTSSPYYYFSSGRWPFAIKTSITNYSDTIYFVNLHAKAFAGSADHNRRAGGALRMTDSLNGFFSQQKVVVLGDYNDKLEGAITQGFTVSPYNYMLQNGFKGITLPSRFLGQTTYLGSSNSLIDNITMNIPAYSAHIAGTTAILKEVDNAFDNFGNSTSDHLPVLSYLRLNKPNSTNIVLQEKKCSLVQPNGRFFYAKIPYSHQPVTLRISTLNGHVVYEGIFLNTNIIQHSFDWLNGGIYLVEFRSTDFIEHHKWLIP